MTCRLRSAAALCAALALTAAAAGPAAADTTVVADPAARQVTALDGTIVWVADTADGRQRLMQHADGAAQPVEGAPAARVYRSIDLGRDRRNRLTLTYLRCDTSPSRCVARQDDLNGGRASIRGLVPAGCSLGTAPALWRERAAYGLACRRGGRVDPLRSGLYVKTGSGAPRRRPRPADAARFGVWEATSVDLRGTRVAAVLADIYSYAVSANAGGADDTRAFLAAASEGDTDAHAVGLALGPGATMWQLTDSEHAGDPLQAVVNRLRGDCREFEVLTSAPGEQRFRAVDVAADGGALYLVVPGTGIVAHEFTPSHPCA